MMIVNTVEDNGQKNNKKRKARKKEERKNNLKRKRIRIRKFPILLRILVVLVVLCISLLLGVMFGYGVLGDGNMLDALDKATWQHIIDIVKKEE